MKWVTIRDGTKTARIGIVVESEIRVLKGDSTICDLLATGSLSEAGEHAYDHPWEVVPVTQAELLAPIPRPPSFRDFTAFEDHVVTTTRALGKEIDPIWYEIPAFYFSNPAAVIGPDVEVSIPKGSVQLDFELEVGIVIGKPGSNLAAQYALDYVAGLTILNDWSARDLQIAEMVLNLGPAKGKDFATSLGPWLVTLDELEERRTPRAWDLAMSATVNGRQYSEASLSALYWSAGDLVAYASRNTVLLPGDIIGTGTCGTGCILELALVNGEEAYPWLSPGDEVTLTVEGLGSLRNRVGHSAQ